MLMRSILLRIDPCKGPVPALCTTPTSTPEGRHADTAPVLATSDYDRPCARGRELHVPTHTGTVELSATYKYDAFGNRIESDVTTTGTVTTKFAMDGWDPATRGIML
jgi:YD repeat-containing protein